MASIFFALILRRSTYSPLRMPSMPCRAPRILPILPAPALPLAAATAPQSDAFITIEGPPDWAITMFLRFAI